jgi:hypothetical protein
VDDVLGDMEECTTCQVEQVGAHPSSRVDAVLAHFE